LSAAGVVQKPGDRSTGTIIGIGPTQELAFEVRLQRRSVQLEHELVDVGIDRELAEADGEPRLAQQ
jgi:hypothetical protein